MDIIRWASFHKGREDSLHCLAVVELHKSLLSEIVKIVDHFVIADPKDLLGDESHHGKVIGICLDAINAKTADEGPLLPSHSLLLWAKPRVESAPEVEVLLTEMVDKRIERDHLVEQLGEFVHLLMRLDVKVPES